MNKKNKFIALAIGLMPILVLGVAFSIPRPSETKAAASETIIYDYYSKTDSGLSSAVPQIANWVTSDSNGSNQTFTFNVGGYNATTPYTYLGGTAGTVLTGTLPGQFVYGNPTLKALANKTNITNFKKLYGFRMNSDVDLTNFLNISVTISWEAGGVGSYTGFIAQSSTGDAEAWSLLTAGKLPIDGTLAGSLSFSDSTNTVLMGKSMMRFALIFGSGSTKLALRNLSITIKGYPRKTLDSVSEGYLDVVHEYGVNEPIDFTKFHLKASYSYPTSTELINGSDSRVTFYDNVAMSTPISKTTHTFSTIGNKNIYYRLVDTTLTSTLTNDKYAVKVINIGERNLTGIEIVENNSASYYKYDRYAPSIVVYPLYNDQTSHASFDGPIPSTDYTMSLAANTMFTVAGTIVNTITLEPQLGSLYKSINVVVNSGRENDTPTLSLTGQIMAFYLYEPFSIDGLILKADWALGADTTPTFSSSSEDGTYNVSKEPGTMFSALGTEVITLTYYINGSSVTKTYSVSIDNNIYTFFNHAFSDGSEWGASTTVAYGAITNRTGNITNSVTGWHTSTSWILNTTVDSAINDNGAFVVTTTDSEPAFLRFGTANAGPTTISLEGANFPAITNPENTLNGITRITIDAEAGASGALTVSVAGVKPTSYAINYGTAQSGSIATTVVGAYNSYTFYFPYTVIGKIRVNYTNAAAPKYFDLGNFSVVGYKLSLDMQVETFATMLNNTNTCSYVNYPDLKIVYDYLVTKGVAANLANYTMNLQSGYSTLNALQVWEAYASRASAQKSTLITIDSSTKNILVIVAIIGVGTFLSFAAFISLKKKKQKLD